MSRYVVVATVALSVGCLEKPAPWVPDGVLGDGVGAGEVDVRAADGGPELLTDVGEIGPDIELPDFDGVAELDVPPDEDVPEVVPTPLLLRGPSVCPGASGAWQGTAYRSTVGWHRNTLMREE